MLLENQVAIVTGAAQGIGEAIIDILVNNAGILKPQLMGQ
jgi:NAD(P)-dependent dehydrogenase (short-subunit alcohol dehydrogenase family)